VPYRDARPDQRAAFERDQFPSRRADNIAMDATADTDIHNGLQQITAAMSKLR